MKEVIQFSDNLYYVTELIKTISTASELVLNPNLVSQKISNDISFISASLDQFTLMLMENSMAPSTSAHLRGLVKSRSAFKNAMIKLLESDLGLFDPEGDQVNYFKFTANRQGDVIQKIIDKLIELEKSEDNSVCISTEEMNLLLKE